MTSWLKVQAEVARAASRRLPVVALESTIISHGMPFPENLKTAQSLERIIRDYGATPATIAILDHHVHVGLDQDQLCRIAQPNNEVAKCAKRDISFLLASGQKGATTVSSTMWAASQVGIQTFVTGGIGGVHRNAETSFDISSDLTELGKTPVAVICAGAKSILDIGKTLEYLETQGVPVCTLHPSYGDFPAFYTPSSGFKSPMHVKTIDEAANWLSFHFDTNSGTGALLAVPIPDEFAADGSIIENAIQQALKEANERGITGKETTPFLLKRVAEQTKGASLKANIALVKHNAHIGAQVASKLAELNRQKHDHSKQVFITNPQSLSQNHVFLKDNNLPRPLFVGASVMDIICRFQPLSQPPPSSSSHLIPSSWLPYFHTSSPAHISHSVGGVARNAFESCHHILSQTSSSPVLVSPIANDPTGTLINRHFASHNMDPSGLFEPSSMQQTSAVYNALLDEKGGLIAAGFDGSIFNDTHVNEKVVQKVKDANASMICMDGNFTTQTMEKICAEAWKNNIPVWIEPTSVVKSTRFITDKMKFGWVDVISPNIEELIEISTRLKDMERLNEIQPIESCSVGNELVRKALNHGFSVHVQSDNNENDLVIRKKDVTEKIATWMSHIMPVLAFIPNVVLKLGADGALLAQRLTSSDLRGALEELDDCSTPNGLETATQLLSDPYRHWHWKTSDMNCSFHDPTQTNISLRWYSADSQAVKGKIVNVTGAGDSLVGASIGAMSILENSWPQSITDRLSWKAKCALFMSDSRATSWSQNVNRMMTCGRRAAELSLLTREAVNPEIRSIRV